MRTKLTSMVKGFTLIEAIAALVIAIVFMIAVGGPAVKAVGGVNITYSEGQRTGLVYKLSQKGLIWKTYEGALSLQLTTRNSEGGLINQVFLFSVSDPKVAQELEVAAMSGRPVTVHYKQYLVRGYKYGSTDYDVTRVTTSTPIAVESR